VISAPTALNFYEQQLPAACRMHQGKNLVTFTQLPGACPHLFPKNESACAAILRRSVIGRLIEEGP
jgi:hypothetical protein